MASFTSVISIFVLLATYGYSLPIGDKFETSTYPTYSTSDFESTTGTTIVDNANLITAQLMSKTESANVPIVKVTIGDFNKYSFESTTPAHLESHEDVPRSLPIFDDGLFGSTPSSDLHIHERYFNDLSDATTFRPSTSSEEETFKYTYTKPTETKNRERAFAGKEGDMDKSSSAEVFSSTPVVERESDKSTSAEKFTGFRAGDRTEETSTRMSMGMRLKPTRPSMTGEPEEVDRSNDVSNFLRPLTKTEQFTKTVQYLPGEIKKSQSFVDFLSESIPTKPKELNQGQKQSDI